jgi:Mrp family chromosome partitioning ATPase
LAPSNENLAGGEPKVGKSILVTNLALALAALGNQAGYNDLRGRIMSAAECSKRTAQIVIAEACQGQPIIHDNGLNHIPIELAAGLRRGGRGFTGIEVKNSATVTATDFDFRHPVTLSSGLGCQLN